MSKKVNRKLSDESRMFQEDWEEDYFVVPSQHGLTTCLICRCSVILKVYNIARHYKTKHQRYDEIFTRGSLIRKKQINILKNSLEKQQNMMSAAISQHISVTSASYEVCYVLGKHMKPFTDAEIVKECFISASNVLFDSFSNKSQIISKIKDMQLSDSTCVRRIEHIGKHIADHVMEDWKNCKYFSLAIDSSTDISATSQCSLFIRYITDNNSIHEDFLKYLPMKNQTRGTDYLDIITTFVDNNDVDIRKLVSICTDGCPSMVGSENGFVALLRKKYNLENLISFHCILHQENLAARIPNTKIDSMMKTVINIINFIRSRELNHRKFKSLLEEINSNYSDVILHTSVRWLSRGKAMHRFYSLRQEIILFLQQNNKVFSELENDDWWCLLAFVSDITEKLNELNRGLQGEQRFVSEMANKVFAFEDKLKIYFEEMQNKIVRNFPRLTKAAEDGMLISADNYVIISEYLAALCKEFEGRFYEMRNLKNCLLFVENPWHLETATITQLSALGFEYAKLFDEYIDFKNDTNLEILFKEMRGDKNYAEFWKLLPAKYETLHKCANLLLTMFASNYLCESSFSKMKYAKNVYRNRITDAHLDAVLRIACTTYIPDFSEIVNELNQTQKSH